MTTEFKLRKIPKDNQIEHTVDYIKACGIHRSQMAGVNDLYEKASLVCDKFQLKSLIDLAYLSVNTTVAVDENLICTPFTLANTLCEYCNILSEKIKNGQVQDYENNLLSHRHILKLLLWIESYNFPNEKQKASLVNDIRLIAKEYLNLRHKSTESNKHRQLGPLPREYVVAIALHFLFLDVYDDTILGAVYSDERILETVKDNKNILLEDSLKNETKDLYQLNSRIVYDLDTDQVISLRRGFQMINGILEVNYPTYAKAGRTIHPSHIQYLNTWFGKYHNLRAKYITSQNCTCIIHC